MPSNFWKNTRSRKALPRGYRKVSRIILRNIISSHQGIAELGGHRDGLINRSLQCSCNFSGGKGLFGHPLQPEFIDGGPFPLGGPAYLANDALLARRLLQHHLPFSSLALVLDRIRRLPDRRRGRVLRTGKRLSIQDVKFPARREKYKATAIPDDEARRTMVSLYDVIIGHVGACRCGLQINVCWRDR